MPPVAPAVVPTGAEPPWGRQLLESLAVPTEGEILPTDGHGAVPERHHRAVAILQEVQLDQRRLGAARVLLGVTEDDARRLVELQDFTANRKSRWLLMRVQPLPTSSGWRGTSLQPSLCTEPCRPARTITQ